MSSSPSDSIHLVLVTAPDADAAMALAEVLVEERLIACGNVIPGITSVYRWEGRVHRDGEALLVLKAPRSRVAELLDRIPALHPYDVPEVLVLNVAEGHPPYLEWVVRESTGSPESP